MYNVLNPPITARYVRILPVSWLRFTSLRMEIYGCQGNVQNRSNVHVLLPSESSMFAFRLGAIVHQPLIGTEVPINTYTHRYWPTYIVIREIPEVCKLS